MSSANERAGRLLIIDGDERFANSLMRMLNADGHKCTWVSTCQMATEALARGAWDVLLTAVVMPRASGLDMLGELRRRRDPTPVILMADAPSLPTALDALRQLELLHHAMDGPNAAVGDRLYTISELVVDVGR